MATAASNLTPHLFWGEAYLAYTLPNLKHSFAINLVAGTSIDADRLSAYRLGGFLAMVAEFPLSIPGYYYQEISATKFFLAAGDYNIPLDKGQRWNLNATPPRPLLIICPACSSPRRLEFRRWRRRVLHLAHLTSDGRLRLWH